MSEQEIFEKLVSEKLEKERGPFGFEGQNCDMADQDCDGWDGVSGRCNCGNRRVSWVLSNCQTFIYAEAW